MSEGARIGSKRVGERGTRVNVGKVITGFSMSLDGFIARPDGSPGPLFDWYYGGDTAIAYPGGRVAIRVSAASAGIIREMVRTTGALVVGRRHFDEANGWVGRHPLDVPVFVVSHRPPPAWLAAESPFTFVADGVASAIALAREGAGERNVGVGGADVAQQALAAGLIDEIGVELVPVLLGEGRRFFDHLGTDHIELERTRVIEAPGVTHLRFRVVK